MTDSLHQAVWLAVEQFLQDSYVLGKNRFLPDLSTHQCSSISEISANLPGRQMPCSRIELLFNI